MWVVEVYDKVLLMMSDLSDGKWFIFYVCGIINECLGDWFVVEVDFCVVLELNFD